MNLADDFCQRNPMWADRPFGTKRGSTISKHGCLMCSIGHAARELAYPGLTAWEWNQILLENDGYEDGNLVKHSVASRLLGMQYAAGKDYAGPMPAVDLPVVEGILNQGGLIFVKVNSNPFGKTQDHWVRLLSRDNSQAWRIGGASRIYDPWWGDEIAAMESYYAPGNKRGFGYAWWGWRAYLRK